MARRVGRRPRRKYTWFPLLGTGAEDPQSSIAGTEILLTGVGIAPVYSVFPLTFDQPKETIDTTGDTGLSEIVGSEYIIERVVGNCFVNLAIGSGDTDNNTNSCVLVTAGFFVARANDNLEDASQPVGSANNDEIFANYAPQSPQTIREPWMWRRSWLLGNFPNYQELAGNNAVTTVLAQGANRASTTLGAYPRSNVFYTTDSTNHFVDIRSNRRVGNDERLFFIISAQNYLVDTGSTAVRTIVGLVDVRILGALRRAQGKSTF